MQRPSALRPVSRRPHHRVRPILVLLTACCAPPAVAQTPSATTTVEIPFVSHDGYPMRGRLTLPAGVAAGAPVVVYVQTAEGMTIDMRRPAGRGGTFDYFDLYTAQLPPLGIGFFRYDGRGITTGDAPPRYERIDTAVYNTSTLDNKVRDAMAAVAVLRAQPGVDPARIILMGTSEGTLIAAEAAARLGPAVRAVALYAVLPDNMRVVFRYILSDGGFTTYRRQFDTDRDGRISRAEFEADPRRYRERVLRNAPFGVFDRDGDSAFTVADLRVLTAHLDAAVVHENYVVLDAWARTAAAVATPAHWFRDHFAHEPIWTFLSRLTVPVGLFHGEDDENTPVSGVRRLEALARDAGQTNLRFHYVAGADHALDLGRYFARGEVPPGHQALFAYLAEVAR